MRHIIYSSLSAVLVVLLLTGCGASRQVAEAATNKLPKVKTKVLMHRLDSLSEQRPTFFYTKLKTRYDSPDNHISFKTTIKMVKDSATNVLITFAHIPMYIGMITTDSFTLVDKRNHCFIHQGIDYFKKQFKVDFTYRNIEELLLGMPLAWEDFSDKYRVKDPFAYIIAAKHKKDEQGNKVENNDMSIRYFLSDDAKFLEKTEIARPRDSVYITIRYFDRKMVDGYNLPSRESVEIDANGKKMSLNLIYTNSKINERRTLYLAIPNKYKQCD